MKIATIFIFTAMAGVAACSSRGEPAPAGGSERAAEQPVATAPTHLLAVVSYHNGVFKAESVARVPGALVQPRSGGVRGGLTYHARRGSTALMVAGAPDPREVHVEFVDPTTGKMQRQATAAPGKQHFLIHLPDTTDGVDFYEPPAASRGSSARTSLAAAPSAQVPLGSITLSGLI